MIMLEIMQQKEWLFVNSYKILLFSFLLFLSENNNFEMKSDVKTSIIPMIRNLLGIALL